MFLSCWKEYYKVILRSAITVLLQHERLRYFTECSFLNMTLEMLTDQMSVLSVEKLYDNLDNK